jgi:hypothetical protein
MERSAIQGRLAIGDVVPHFAEFIIGPAEGRTRWLHAGYEAAPNNTPAGATLAGPRNDVIVLLMTTLLDQGIQAVRELPPERQDMAGELLLRLAATAPQYELTVEQIEDLKLAVAQADRGEFASDQEVADTWKKFGR